MARYEPDPRLDWRENKRLAMEAHEAEGATVQNKHGLWLFPDGAVLENHAMSHVIEPPDDPHERLLRIREYWRTRAELAARKFKDRKAQVVEAVKALGFLTVGDNKDLQRLAEEARTATGKLKAVEAQLAPTAEERAVSRDEAEADARKAAMLQIVEAITIEEPPLPLTPEQELERIYAETILR